MKVTFFETRIFTATLAEYLNDAGYREFQQFLLNNPEAGDVMPGTGGFRKVRWADSRRGKGKRGGLRVIYYWLAHDRQIWMFAIYGKDEMADLSADEKKSLKKAIEAEFKTRGS